MTGLRRRPLILAGLPALASCASSGPTRFDRGANPSVRRILVLAPEFGPNAREILVPMQGGAPMAGDLAGALVGALVVGAMQGAADRRHAWAHEALAGLREEAARRFVQHAVAELRARGFEPLTVPLPAGAVFDASLVTTVEDLRYDLNPLVGPMGPTLRLRSRLVRNSDDAVLLSVQPVYAYGLGPNTPRIGSPAEWVVMPQDPAFRYERSGDQAEDSRRLRACVLALMGRSAEMVVSHLA
jgi:hypothetical protein